jgi:hypothetical protein
MSYDCHDVTKLDGWDASDDRHMHFSARGWWRKETRVYETHINKPIRIEHSHNNDMFKGMSKKKRGTTIKTTQ